MVQKRDYAATAVPGLLPRMLAVVVLGIGRGTLCTCRTACAVLRLAMNGSSGRLGGMLEDDGLLLAMPRRELFRLSGFSRKVDLAVLNSLSDESWFSSRNALQQNPDAKEVQLGLIAVRPGDDGMQALVSQTGVMLHVAPIPVEIGHLGPGLSALRSLALAAGSQLVGGATCQVELFGYCNEESMPECREFFIMVYLLRVPQACRGPADMNWIGVRHLAGVPLDPVSVLLAEHLRP
jgi:hypothetical protein